MGLVRGSECSETRAVVFEKINLWVAGVDRTHFPTAGETAPHADSSQKSGLAKQNTSHEHDGSRRAEAERKEEQRASGRPFLAEPELTTGLLVGFDTKPDGRNATASFGAASVSWLDGWQHWSRLRTGKGQSADQRKGNTGDRKPVG